MAVKAKAEITISRIIDISSVTRYYLLQSSTASAPSKPTANPPGGSWSTTEPSYTSGSTNTLYFVDLTVMTNNTFSYSAVSKSSSYEAAKVAYNKAVSVETRVTSAETKIEQNKTDIALRATKTEVNALVEGNLIVNGYGLNKDNYNFSQWTFNGADKCDGFPSFSYTGKPTEIYIPQNIIPIDPSKTYEFRMSFKGDSSKKLYLGRDEFDIDGKQILATYSMGFSASTTTLAKELKDGDTVVYLTSASGWTDSTLTHQLGLIFWNYKDSTGYQYPEGVYSRNAWTNLYTSDNVDKTKHTITLTSAWTHGTFAAGTKVSQSNSSGHKYFNYSNKAYPADWTETSYIFGGSQPLYSFQSSKINQAAKYMRFVILHNYGGGTTSSTTKISKASFRDVTLEKNLTDNYYTKTQTDAKIKVESDKITSAVSRISTNEAAISTLEQTADGLTVRLNTTDSNVTKAQTTANTANTTANSVKSDLANNYTEKTLPDTRSDNKAPSWYFENYPKQIITEFKNCSTIGLSGVGTYCTLQTIVPWTDSSGGYPKQTAKVEGTGKEYWRVGTSATTWSSWVDPYGLATTANTNAANAAKTATNYLGFSTSGLVVGDMTASSLGKNVLIDSDSVDIRNGTTTLASFGANTIYLGKNSDTSVINLCNGSATMRVKDSTDFRIYTDKRLVMSAYKSMLLDCYRDSTHMTRIAIQSSDPDDTSFVGGVSFTIYQGSVQNTVSMLNDDIELKVTDGTNTTRMNIDPSILKIYAASRIRLNSKSSVQIAEGSSYSAGILLGNSYTVAKSINCYWSDGSIHDLVSNNKSGQASYFGPADIDEATTTYIRGKYVRLYNHSGGGVYLGSSGSTAITSDRNLKKDILDIDDKYLDFFDRLRPVTYKYDCPENKGHRDHVGFVAQEVEEALQNSGLTTEQFAGLVIEKDVTLSHDYDSSSTDEDNAANEQHYDTLYSLRYEEFISLLVKKVQSLQEQIDQLHTDT